MNADPKTAGTSRKHGRIGRFLKWLCLGVLLILALLALFAEDLIMYGYVGSPAQLRRAMTNIRTLKIQIAMYSRDNQGAWPASIQELKAGMKGQMAEAALSDFGTGAQRRPFNLYLKSTGSDSKPFVVAADPDTITLKKWFRAHEVRVVLVSDASGSIEAKAMDESEFQAILSKQMQSREPAP